MSGVGLKINAAEVLARLKGMEDRGGNLTAVMRDGGEHMKGSIEQNFARAGRPDKWPPLRFSTLVAWHTGRKSFWTKSGSKMTKRGKAAWEGRLPLTVTSRLRRANHYIAGARSLGVFNNVIYAAIHQFAGMAGRGRKTFIPARPFLLFQDDDVLYIQRNVLSFIMTGRLG